MKTNRIVTDELLDELLSVFFHKFIYYIPKEIIIEGVIDQLKGEIEDDFFDEFYFIDNYLGSSKFYNEDALELSTLINDKRSFLQQNTFKLAEQRKEITEFEFLVVIEKYYEFLMLFIFITEWLSENLKKYNGNAIHLSIIGAYSIQQNYFATHLKDICNYFGEVIDLEIDFDFSIQSFVPRYLPELISRIVKIGNDREEQIVENDFEKKGKKLDKCNQEPINKQPEKITIQRKKLRPQIDEKRIEIMIYTQVFNIKEEVLQQ